MASRAEELFKKIKAMASADQTKHVEDWVISSELETEYLDFKNSATGSSAQKGKSTGNDAETWSRILCGFANTVGGGVVVWGIDARPDPAKKGLDCAKALTPLDHPEKHIQFLQQQLQNSVKPIPTNTDFFVVKSTTGPKDSGYVICLVPEGKNKPYRAMRVKDQPHLYRVGSSTQAIPTDILLALLNPRPCPQLGCNADIHDSDTEYSISFSVIIDNAKGSGTARDIKLEVVIDRGHASFFDEAGTALNVTKKKTSVVATELSLPVQLHPGQKVKALTTTIRGGSKGHAVASKISITCYMADEKPQYFEHRFKWDDFSIIELGGPPLVEIEGVERLS